MIVFALLVYFTGPKTAYPVGVEGMTKQEFLEWKELTFPEPLTVEEIIKLNTPEPLHNVAKCESGFILNAKNPKSSASGVFQVIDGTFEASWQQLYGTEPDYSMKNDIYVQIDIANLLYKNNGLGDWAEPCGTLRVNN